MRFATVFLINLLLLSQLVEARAETLYVIAHKKSFSIEKDAEYIADYYLLKRKINASGNKIIPINLPSDDPLRNQFSQAVFHRSPIALGEYWDRMSFRGVKPPVVQNSEKSVLLFVKRIRGAIGYVNHKPADDADVLILQEINL